MKPPALISIKVDIIENDKNKWKESKKEEKIEEVKKRKKFW